MASEENTISFNLHPSPDGALDILVGAGIDHAAAERILGIVPEQHDNEPGHTAGSNEASRTSFEGRMMAMMEGFSQKLNELASRVESTDGATGSGTSTEVPPSPTPSSASTSRTDNSSHLPTPWADRRLDEPLNLPPVQWPDDEESESPGNLVEVSPETTSFLQSCFGKPLNNSARQGLRKTVDVSQSGRDQMPKVGPRGEGKRLKRDEGR